MNPVFPTSYKSPENLRALFSLTPEENPFGFYTGIGKQIHSVLEHGLRFLLSIKTKLFRVLQGIGSFLFNVRSQLLPRLRGKQ